MESGQNENIEFKSIQNKGIESTIKIADRISDSRRKSKHFVITEKNSK